MNVRYKITNEIANNYLTATNKSRTQTGGQNYVETIYFCKQQISL